MRTPHEDPNNPLFHWGGGGQPSDVNLEKPLIAAINGFAVGVGLSLALQCQLRVMAEDAWIGDTHTKVGRLGSAHNLYATLPRTTAAYLTLCNGRLTAQECLQQAIVNKVVPRDQLIAAAEQLAEMICDSSPLAVQAAVRLYRLTAAFTRRSSPMRATSTRRPPRAKTAPKGRARSANAESRSGRAGDARRRLVRRADAAARAALRRGDRGFGSRGKSRRPRGQIPRQVRLSRTGLAGERRAERRCRPAVLSQFARAPRAARSRGRGGAGRSGDGRDPGLHRVRRCRRRWSGPAASPRATTTDARASASSRRSAAPAGSSCAARTASASSTPRSASPPRSAR